MLDVTPHAQQDAKDIEELVAALRNEDGDIRAMAAQELGIQGNRQAVGPLLAALNDPHSSLVRCNAAEALGKIGDVRAVEPLIASL
jgi:HEAT repeat protein